MVHCLVSPSQGRHIRIPSAIAIIVALPLLAVGIQIRPHCVFLPHRAVKVQREPSGGEVRRHLGAVPFGRPYSRDVRAGRRKSGQETCRVGAVIGKTGHARPEVSGGGNDGYAASPELAKRVADSVSVGLVEDLLVCTVGYRYRLGKPFIWELQKVGGQFEVGLCQSR